MPIHNPGMELDLEWLGKVTINLPAVNKRAASLSARRGVKKDYQAAWLLRAATCVDLTTLAGDDSFSNVQRLCFKANSPIRQDLIEGSSICILIRVVLEEFLFCATLNTLKFCLRKL